MAYTITPTSAFEEEEGQQLANSVFVRQGDAVYGSYQKEMLDDLEIYSSDGAIRDQIHRCDLPQQRRGRHSVYQSHPQSWVIGTMPWSINVE